MATAFSHHLPHFSLGATGLDGEAGLRELGSGESPVPQTDLVAEAEERGRLEGEQAARAAFELARQEDAADYELRLAEQQQQWAERTADVLANQIRDGLSAVEQSLADHTARVLAGFLEDETRHRALNELSRIVREQLLADATLRVTISGPPQLLDQLRPRLDDHVVAIDYRPGDASPDVSVMIDDSMVETQLGAWGGVLAEAGGGEAA